MREHDKKHWIAVAAALAAIYLIWGTTYAAIRVVVSSLPPLLAGGLRFLVAGAGLTGVLILRGEPLPRRRHYVGPAITALLMMLGSHGLVALAEVHVPSGQAAVVMSTMPMWMALLLWLAPGGRRPPAMVIAGIALGFAGVWLLCRPSGAVEATPLLTLACAPPLWALGSILTPRLPQPPSAMMATGLQMFMGGAMLLTAGSARGELTDLTLANLANAGAAPWLALAYLALFGSVVALCAYTWLLRTLGPGPVSTYSFINPLVAVIFGHLALGEQPSRDLMLGGGLVVGAVALVLAGRLAAKVTANNVSLWYDPDHGRTENSQHQATEEDHLAAHRRPGPPHHLELPHGDPGPGQDLRHHQKRRAPLDLGGARLQAGKVQRQAL